MIDVETVVAGIRRRDFDRQGIPMYLTLAGAVPAPVGDPRRTEGWRLAEELAVVHAQLAGRHVEGVIDLVEGGVDDDHIPVEIVSEEERLLTEALSVLAYSEFGPAGTVDHGIARQDGQSGRDGRDGQGGQGGQGGREPQDEQDGSRAPGDTAAESAAGSASRLDAAITAFREGRFIRVVNYHNTPAGTEERLRAELIGYGARFAAVGIDQLDTLISTGEWDRAEPPLIPVFYEGYRNNAEVAAPICEAAGLTAWFFVVTGFVDTPPDEQISYARAHDIILVPEEHGLGRVAMTWDQAASLSERHVVTSHTANHQSYVSVRTPDDFERELVAPSAAVERATGRAAPAHAWLYGTGLGRSPEHDAALRNVGYRWCFSNTVIHALLP